MSSQVRVHTHAMFAGASTCDVCGCVICLQAAVSFAAVSTDGYVTLWVLHKGKLSHRVCTGSLSPYPYTLTDTSCKPLGG